MAAKRYVIIGDGAAGTTAAQYLRATDGESTIAILSDDPHPAYFRAALTNYLLGELREEHIWAVPPSFYEELRIHRVLARVSEIDVSSSTVQLTQGGKLPYDALLIAAGARARTPYFNGWWLPGVMTMRTLGDVRRVVDLIKLRSLRSAVVYGGGPLALEWAHGLAHRGVKVVMVVRDPRFLPTTIDNVASDLLLARLRLAGVEVRLNEELSSALAGPDGRVSGAVTRSGEMIPCEVIAAAIGVVPNTEVFARSGIDLATNGAIVVDSAMKTSLPNIWAAGDIISFKGRVLQLWEPARVQARVAAANMSGKQDQRYSPGAHYMATRLYDLDCASIGDVTSQAEELVDFPQKTGQISYRKLCIRNNAMVGALMLGERAAQVRRLGRAFKRLIDNGMDITPIRGDLLEPGFDLPGWLNTHSLVQKPQTAMDATVLRVPLRIRAAQEIRLSDLPPLPTTTADLSKDRELALARTTAPDPSEVEPVPEAKEFQPPGSQPPPRVFLEGLCFVGKIEVKGPSAIIGRDPKWNIPLTDPRVASAHAEIAIAGQAVYIRDLGSDGGTWVNGTAVGTPRRLRDRDKIFVGGTELVVYLEGTAAAAAAASPAAGPPPAQLQQLGSSWTPGGAATPHLDVKSGRSIGLSFELIKSPTPVAIGRDPRSGIRLDDEWIDASHAWLRMGPSSWEIADAESNGVTKKNGVVLRPNEWTPLQVGDVIEVGYVALVFTMRPPLVLAALGNAGPPQPQQIRPSYDPSIIGPPSPRHAPPTRSGGVLNAVAMPAMHMGPGMVVAAQTPAQPPVQQPYGGRNGRLWIENGPGRGSCANLGDVTVIGAQQGQCTLLIADPLVGAKHVEIARQPDGFYARDLGAPAGTLCRGQRLGPAPFKLNHGDLLVIGMNVALRFEASV